MKMKTLTSTIVIRRMTMMERTRMMMRIMKILKLKKRYSQKWARMMQMMKITVKTERKS